MTLGTYLRDARLGARMSMRKLGRRAGYTHAFVREVEIGRQIPTRSYVDAVARVLGFDPTRWAYVFAKHEVAMRAIDRWDAS